MPKSSRRRSSPIAIAPSSMDKMSFPNAKQDEPQVPPPAHIEPVSLGLPDGDRGVESFSSMFSDCGFLVNDATKRRSVLSSKSKPQDRYSFLSFTHEDPLELSDLGYRNSQFVRLPDEDRDLESPSTLVEKDNFDYQDGIQLARLPPVEGTKLWSLMIV